MKRGVPVSLLEQAESTLGLGKHRLVPVIVTKAAWFRTEETETQKGGTGLTRAIGF